MVKTMNTLGMKGYTKLVEFWKNEKGLGTLEIILIIAVVIMIALLFKGWIIELVKDLMGKADDQANSIFD
ncbi:Flp1 family type IVb pilin [Paenibacillus sp. HB172176]|uniref:Flp1 family type IVb pilin n=1 Tax=Paenibacillus sp. HB172176 TaxID=2493690 RepID=UPI001F0FE38F|nr:Flp1 family type IVb pilin [Paenibacillus sp. HB172176]